MKKLVLPLVMIACLVAVTASIADGDDAVTEQHQLAPGLTSLIGVFERPRVATDQVPIENVDLVKLDGRPGEDPSLSRRVELGDGDVAYLWPMRDGLCYASPGGDGCVSLDRIRAGMDVGSESMVNRKTGQYESVRVFGVVRNGIEQVTLRLPSGGRVDAAVRDNVFMWSGTAEAPVAVHWTDDEGTHAEQLPTLSPEALEAMRTQ